MITEDTIVLIEETYCLKVQSMAFQYNFYFFILFNIFIITNGFLAIHQHMVGGNNLGCN